MAEGVFAELGDQHFQYPHCNTEVLHAPGVCDYCDHYPDRQAARAASGGAFTPPEANGWYGNVAQRLSSSVEERSLDVREAEGSNPSRDTGHWSPHPRHGRPSRGRPHRLSLSSVKRVLTYLRQRTWR